MNVTCEAAGASCDNVASAFRLGRRVSLQRDTVAIAGVAATFKRSYIGRATVNFHELPSAWWRELVVLRSGADTRLSL